MQQAQPSSNPRAECLGHPSHHNIRWVALETSDSGNFYTQLVNPCSGPWKAGVTPAPGVSRPRNTWVQISVFPLTSCAVSGQLSHACASVSPSISGDTTGTQLTGSSRGLNEFIHRDTWKRALYRPVLNRGKMLLYKNESEGELPWRSSG